MAAKLKTTFILLLALTTINENTNKNTETSFYELLEFLDNHAKETYVKREGLKKEIDNLTSERDHEKKNNYNYISHQVDKLIDEKKFLLSKIKLERVA